MHLLVLPTQERYSLVMQPARNSKAFYFDFVSDFYYFIHA